MDHVPGRHRTEGKMFTYRVEYLLLSDKLIIMMHAGILVPVVDPHYSLDLASFSRPTASSD
jgi:hypothetical protein